MEIACTITQYACGFYAELHDGTALGLFKTLEAAELYFNQYCDKILNTNDAH